VAHPPRGLEPPSVTLAAAAGARPPCCPPPPLGWYAAMGHGDAFVQANFLSIFDRHEPFSRPCGA
jgi:hypothetical protein